MTAETTLASVSGHNSNRIGEIVTNDTSNNTNDVLMDSISSIPTSVSASGSLSSQPIYSLKDSSLPDTSKTIGTISLDKSCISTRKRSADDFKFLECIGEGSYSKVYRAVSKKNVYTYAIKILNKQHIHKEKKRKYVTIEKNTLNVLGKHPGIVTLYYTFQDPISLYFVIDFAQNGELLNLMHKLGSLSVELAKYYTIQLIDTISFIHGKGIIHRDLKPENILLGCDWKLMITDFGAAKFVDEPVQGKDQQNLKENDDITESIGSFVGTAEYISPELLKFNQSSFASDYWSLGCIIYQMFVGIPPFKATNEYETFEKIVDLIYAFPDPHKFPLPSNIVNLVKKLLVDDPNERLGSNEIKAHPWFKDINWNNPNCIWGPVPKLEPYRPEKYFKFKTIAPSSLQKNIPKPQLASSSSSSSPQQQNIVKSAANISSDKSTHLSNQPKTLAKRPETDYVNDRRVALKKQIMNAQNNTHLMNKVNNRINENNVSIIKNVQSPALRSINPASCATSLQTSTVATTSPQVPNPLAALEVNKKRISNGKPVNDVSSPIQKKRLSRNDSLSSIFTSNDSSKSVIIKSATTPTTTPTITLQKTFSNNKGNNNINKIKVNNNINTNKNVNINININNNNKNINTNTNKNINNNNNNNKSTIKVEKKVITTPNTSDKKVIKTNSSIASVKSVKPITSSPTITYSPNIGNKPNIYPKPTYNQTGYGQLPLFIPKPRVASSDAAAAAGAIGTLLTHKRHLNSTSSTDTQYKQLQNHQKQLINPVLLDRQIPSIITSKLMQQETILKLDNIFKSEISHKANQFTTPGQTLNHEILENIIHKYDRELSKDLKACVMVITSYARLFIYELNDDFRLHNPQSLTQIQALDFYVKIIEIKLTNKNVSLYDYEFDEEMHEGYLILELANVNKLVFLSAWDRSRLIKGGINSNVRVGFNVNENESWVRSFLKAKSLLKKREVVTHNNLKKSDSNNTLGGNNNSGNINKSEKKSINNEPLPKVYRAGSTSSMHQSFRKLKMNTHSKIRSLSTSSTKDNSVSSNISSSPSIPSFQISNNNENGERNSGSQNNSILTGVKELAMGVKAGFKGKDGIVSDGKRIKSDSDRTGDFNNISDNFTEEVTIELNDDELSEILKSTTLNDSVTTLHSNNTPAISSLDGHKYRQLATKKSVSNFNIQTNGREIPQEKRGKKNNEPHNHSYINPAKRESKAAIAAALAVGRKQ